MNDVMKGGVEILIRSIQPEDIPLLVGLFESLSAESIMLRFLSPIRSLSPEILHRLTHIDRNREVALAAVLGEEEGERIIGVSRIMRKADSPLAEFAVVVADAWQGKGIGRSLLEQCLAIAGKLGISRVWGIVLRENTGMIALGRELGFEIKKVRNSNEYEFLVNL